jgi:branched-chain amino acid transport system substrate-binding protein
MLRLSLASAAILALAVPALAAEIPIGHLADQSGATSDVGVPYAQGVADALAYVNRKGGIKGEKMNVESVDYGYQVPRAVALYKKWTGGRDKVAAIQGWGTADTEALSAFVTKDEIPYISGSYAAQVSDPTGASGKAKAAPYNFLVLRHSGLIGAHSSPASKSASRVDSGIP